MRQSAAISPRRWQGSDLLASDPALPAGTRSLADYAIAPAQLLRRLKQIAVADEDSGQPLAVGQRLVTRDGRLRRWDGFVAVGTGAAAAERLLRANRLAQIAGELPGAEQAVESATTERERILKLMEECRGSADEARSAALAAERDAREAARAIDAAAAALDRIEAQRASLGQRQADLDPVLDAAREVGGVRQKARFERFPIPPYLKPRWRICVRARRPQRRPSPTSAPKRRPRRAKQRPIASGRPARGVSRPSGASGRPTPRAGSRRRSNGSASKPRSATSWSAEPAELDIRIGELEHANDQSQVRIGEATAAEREAEEGVVAASEALSAANEQSANTRECRAAAAARAEAQQARSAEFARASVDRFEIVPQRLPEKLGFDADEPRDADAEAATLERVTAERERIGPVNLVAEAELAELDAARTKGAEEAEELTQAIHRLRGSIGNLNREGRVRLLEAYEKVDAHFRRLFMTLFEGGNAHLALVESDDPLEAGLEIMAQPPGKRLSTLTLLSGGEQALTAVALIFAIFLTNPAPICVLDEVDAPLDDANVERFCELLHRMTQETDTRYLIVTHNAVTMSRMDRLYGVTMIEKGVSRLVSVDLGGAETLLAAE